MVKNKYRKPHKIKRKKAFYKKNYFWISIALILIGAELIFLVCFCSFFKIREIKITGNEKIEDQKLTNFVWDKIEKRLLVWSSKSIILANTSRLKEELKISYPYIAEVRINREFPDGLKLDIRKRNPKLIWCSKNKCFKTDKTGIIFDNIIQNKELTLLIDKTRKEIPSLGTKVLNEEEIGKIFDIKERIKEYNIPISNFVIEMEKLTLKTKEGWEVYFALEKDIEWQLTKLKADLEKEISEEQRKKLEYIELRFGNFAPYKFK